LKAPKEFWGLAELFENLGGFLSALLNFDGRRTLEITKELRDPIPLGVRSQLEGCAASSAVRYRVPAAAEFVNP
jgi:hypothetical protein